MESALTTKSERTNSCKLEIVYQIYPKSYQDSNNDGIGDLKGITSHLDDLKDLGVTMIWICPIYPSPMKDNGYDVADYTAIHPDFGTMEDMDELIAQAAKRKISIMMDLVLNHTSDQHAWFQKALRDPASKEHGYYIFQSSPTIPNNLRSVFGGSCWQKVDGRDEYYFHSFSKEQPDLNWENPDLRHEIYSQIEFWKQKGIRAFRMDAINFIKKPAKWENIEPDGPDGLAKCTRVVRNHPGLLDFLHEMNAVCFQPDGILTVAETAGLPYDQLDAYIGKSGCFSMVFDFRHTDLDVAGGDEWFTRKDWKIADLKEKLETSCTQIQKYGTAATFLENHDQPRVTTKYLQNNQSNPKAVKMLAVLQMGLPGVPFLYQGQELGMINFERTSPDQFDDLSSIDQLQRAQEHGYSPEEALRLINLRSRDNARVPYPWNESPNGGFSSTTPWLACNEQAKKQGICFSKQKSDPSSIYSFYKQLIQLRKNPAWSDLLLDGLVTFIHSHPDVIAYQRKCSDKTLEIHCSFANHSVVTNGTSGQIVFSNDESRIPGTTIQAENGQLVLNPFEATIVEIQDEN